MWRVGCDFRTEAKLQVMEYNHVHFKSNTEATEFELLVQELRNTSDTSEEVKRVHVLKMEQQ